MSDMSAARLSIRELRRREIVDAAMDCLAELGWGRTTLSRIAERAEVSRALISYHFDNRDDLLEAVLEAVVQTVFVSGAQRISAAVRAQHSARDMLETYIVENLRFIGAHRREMAALDQVMPNLRRDDESLRFAEPEESPILAELAGIFQHGVDEGEFDAEPTSAAYFVRRGIDGAAQQVVRDSDFDLEQYGRQLVHLVLNGTLRPSTDPDGPA